MSRFADDVAAVVAVGFKDVVDLEEDLRQNEMRCLLGRGIMEGSKYKEYAL